MTERPDLRVVEDSTEPSDCVVCAEPATTSSAADAAPLCLSCFTETHWHPSWARTFPEPGGPLRT